MPLPSVSTQREQVRRRQPSYGLISGALPFNQAPGQEAGTGELTVPGSFIPPPAPEPIQGGDNNPPMGMPPRNPAPMPVNAPGPVRGGGPVGPPIQLPNAFKGRVGREGTNPVAGMGGAGGVMPPAPIPPPPTPTSTLNTGGFGGAYSPTRKPMGKKRGPGFGGLGLY